MVDRPGTMLAHGGAKLGRKCERCEIDVEAAVAVDGRFCPNCGKAIPGQESTVHVDLTAPGPGVAPSAPAPPAVLRPAPKNPAMAQNPAWVSSPPSRSGTIMDIQRNGWGYYMAILFAALVAIVILGLGFVIIREKMAAPASDGGVSVPLDDVPVSIPLD